MDPFLRISVLGVAGLRFSTLLTQDRVSPKKSHLRKGGVFCQIMAEARKGSKVLNKFATLSRKKNSSPSGGEDSAVRVSSFDDPGGAGKNSLLAPPLKSGLLEVR
jgi:hypothetical protein